MGDFTRLCGCHHNRSALWRGVPPPLRVPVRMRARTLETRGVVYRHGWAVLLTQRYLRTFHAPYLSLGCRVLDSRRAVGATLAEARQHLLEAAPMVYQSKPQRNLHGEVDRGRHTFGDERQR